MDLIRRTTNILHDEHMATVAMLNNLEAFLLHHGAKAPPAEATIEVSKILAEVSTVIETEVGRHFAFEEEELFPRLAEMGDGGMGELLKEEHDIVLPLGRQLCAMAQAARTDGFTSESWVDFRQSGMELLERLITHIQKEEMALLPLLDDIIDEGTDGELADRYQGGR